MNSLQRNNDNLMLIFYTEVGEKTNSLEFSTIFWTMASSKIQIVVSDFTYNKYTF